VHLWHLSLCPGGCPVTADNEQLESLRRLQEHALRVAFESEADRRRLEGWADAFMGLYLALAKFEARCLHERRQDCRYCETREALKEARAAMAKETFPDGSST
jgi:hypothetical protein